MSDARPSMTLPPKPEAPRDVEYHIRHRGPLRLQGEAMSDKEFYRFCLQNPDWRIERTANHQIIILPPTGSETGNRNSELNADIVIWNRQHRLGKVFDSSTGFRLPNGADRSPDTAWVRNERWESLSLKERKGFAPIVPDFVIELRSEDQSVVELREKMEEYMACGCRLGWLIDPQYRRTYVYFENGAIQTIAFEESLSGGNVMPGLSIRLADIFT